jgi:TetR/AcrR family transcriptional regulator, transcriptional repressor for nem operon
MNRMSPTRMEQKEHTREEILSSAVRRLREHGISGASVAEVMKGAGLTVGGFYAHFDSKDSLVGAGLRSCMAQMREVMRSHLGAGRGAAAIAPLLNKYLSPLHRDTPQRGCPIPAVISEAAGAGEPVREALRDEFEAHVKVLTEHLEGRSATRRRQALATLALMYGGLAMARAVKGTPLSEEILEACREYGRTALER